jgi:type I restriction enzyme S subunit
MIGKATFSNLLSHVVDNRGKTCPESDIGVPLIATNCVKNTTLFPTFDKVRYVSPETYGSWFRGHPLPGDMIFVLKGAPGQVCLTPNPVTFCIAQDMVAIRANPEKVYPPYLFAALRSAQIQNEIGNMHVGTMIPHFKKGDFDKLQIPLPARSIQEYIGDTYLELSGKVDLNRRMNETLEAMARAIFKDWFVDFGPTRAKMEGRAPYLAPEIWKRFPDRLDDEGKPEGWKVSTLREITTRITKGTTPTSHDLNSALAPDERVNYVRVNALTDAGEVLWNKIEHIPKSIHLGSLKRSVLHQEDILYSIAGTIGRVILVSSDLVPANTNQALAIIRPNIDLVPSRFLLMILQQRDFVEALHANVVHAVQANLSLSMIASAKAILPPTNVISSMFAPAEALIRKREQNDRESQTLAAIRDLLLPKLMSGEIRVKDAEKVTETAL